MAISDDDTIRHLLGTARTIAVVGASPKPGRASLGVMRFLQAHGYRCLPVNPQFEGQEILGEMVCRNLASLPVPVDLVDVFRNSEAAAGTVDEAIAVGAPAVWLQLGVVNEAAAARARAAGLTVVMDRCPAIEIPRLGIRTPGGANR
jgi:predicted CoA-binding protein